jgi:Histidine kinase/Two component regulator propeller
MKLSSQILVFILIICSSYTNAQQPVYKKFDTSNGLPSNFVYQVMQDTKGYIWFATNNGVARYDGFEVEVFGSSNQLASLDVWYFYEDSSGRIWFFTYSGSFHYYCYDDEKFHTIKNPYDKGVSQPITSFTESQDGSIVTSWIVINSKSVYYTIHPDLKVTRHEFILPINKVQVYRSNVKSDKNQMKFNEAGFVMVDDLHPFAEKLYSKMNENVFCFFDQNKNEFVVETKKGIYRKKVEDLGLDDAKFYWIKILNDSTLCFKFEEKIFVTDLQFDIIDKYKFLSKTNLRQVYIDKYSNIWAITMHEGVFLYLNSGINDTWVGNDYFEKSTEVHHIAISDQNEVFASTADGNLYKVSQLYADNKKIENLFKINGDIRDLVLTKDKKRLIFVLAEDYWNIGVLDLVQGLPELQSLSSIPSKKQNSGISLYSDENFKSLYTKNKFTTLASTSLVIVLNHKRSSDDFIVKTRNRTMYAGYNEQTGILWMCGPGGVESYDINSKRYHTQTVFTPIDKIFFDKKNRIWLTSNSYGVFLLDAGILRHVKETNGMIIYDAANIDHDNFYIGTNHGLFILNAPSMRVNKVKNFRENHIYAIDILPDGKIMMGTDHGLVLMRPSDSDESFNCDPVLKKFRMGDKSFHSSEDTIEVDRYENDLSAGIMIPCHLKGKFRMNYKLAGYDKNFTDTYENSISYKKLPFGKFTLDIKIFDDDSEKMVGQRHIYIVIKRHWNETWLFRILIFFFIAGILFFAYTYNIRKLKKKNKIKLEMDQMIANQKLVALQHQLNPHFVFNVLNSIQSFIMKKDTLGANYYLNRFSRLMRHVLESSRHLYIPLKLETDILKTYLELERLRYGDKLNYEVIFDESLDLTKEIPSMVIQPFVENAIKHGVKKIDYPGYINVIFNMEGNLLKVSVLDNGPGISKQEDSVGKDLINVYESRGLQITKERLDAFSQLGYCKLSFSIEENHGELPFDKGTCVAILIEYI